MEKIQSLVLELSRATFVVFFTLVICLAGCSDGSMEPNVDAPLTLDQLVEKVKTRPENVTDNQIAWFLAISFRPDPYNYLHRTPGIIMWQGPMRIAVEDGNGNDLDLSAYPGTVIKSYVTSVAAYTGLPITITKAERHDNNASLVISKDRMIGTAGTLYGVPELAARQHERMSEVLSLYYSKAWDGPDEESIGQFRMGYVNKACVVNLVVPQDYSISVSKIWNSIGGLFHLCIGQEQSSMFALDGPPPVFYQYSEHPAYYWKIFYSSGIKPGMGPDAAQRKICKHLRHHNSPSGQ